LSAPSARFEQSFEDNELAAADPGVIVVLTNLPDRASALKLAGVLIDQRLAACVNVLAECTSVYRWQDKVEKASEVPLLIKTTATTYPRLEAAIRASHPYELPEIIGVPVVAGLAPYLDWIAAGST
jgi:periplasmic divalent cation tolerance protein